MASALSVSPAPNFAQARITPVSSRSRSLSTVRISALSALQVAPRADRLDTEHESRDALDLGIFLQLLGQRQRLVELAIGDQRDQQLLLDGRIVRVEAERVRVILHRGVEVVFRPRRLRGKERAGKRRGRRQRLFRRALRHGRACNQAGGDQGGKDGSGSSGYHFAESCSRHVFVWQITREHGLFMVGAQRRAPRCSIPVEMPRLPAQLTREMQNSTTSSSASFCGDGFSGASASRAISPKWRARWIVSGRAPYFSIRPRAFSSAASSASPFSMLVFQNSRSSSVPRR
jgi:hypothetical protein